MTPFHLALFFIASLSAVYRIFVLSNFEYIFFVDRDLYRALHIFSDWSNLGPELSWGGRIPGNFYYLTLKFLLFFSHHPLFIYAVMLAGQFFLAGLFFRLICREWNQTAAFLFIACFFSLYASLDNSLTIWNPSFAFLFAGMGLYFLFKLILDFRPWAFVLMIFFYSAAAQCHLSHWVLFPISALILLFRRKTIPWPWFLAGIGLGLCMFLPYLYEDSQQGLHNLKMIFQSAQASFAATGPYTKVWEETGPRDLLRNFAGMHFHFFSSMKKIDGPWVGLVTSLGLLAFFLTLPHLKKKNVFLRVNFLLFWGGLLFLAFILGPGELCFRRANFLFFPATFLLSFGLSEMRGWRVGKVFFSLWIAAFLLLNLYFFQQKFDLLFYRKRLNLFTLHSLITELKREHHLSSAAIEHNLLMVLRLGEKWQFNQQKLQEEYPPQGKADLGLFEYTGVSFFNSTIAEVGQSSSSLCALAVPHHDMRGVVDPWSEILADLPIMKDARVVRKSSAQYFELYFYEKIQGNCPKTFTNRYILTEAEKKLEAAAKMKVQLTAQAVLMAPMKETLIISSANTHLEQNFEIETLLGIPLAVAFEVSTIGEKVSVRVHSNELRGYDSITHFHLVNPRLRFENVATKAVVEHWPVPVSWQDYLVFHPPLEDHFVLQRGEYRVTFLSEKVLSKYAY